MNGHALGASNPIHLSPLPVPVHFVLLARSKAWPDLLAPTGEPPDADFVQERILENDDNWIVQTYLRLRTRGLPVTMSKQYKSDAINVISYHDLKARDFPLRYFTVGVRQDSARPCLADHRIVQNPLNIDSPANDHLIPHWPQPGMIERDSSRKCRVENICFKGAEPNLYQAFRTDEFRADLASLGTKLVFDVKDKVTGKLPQWFDYRQCDVILAVRDATVEDMKLKPASKLVNAWRAGCPALLGPEPAFQQLRQSEFDYIEVATPKDAIDAVRRLRDDPNLYQSMVHNGHARGEAYSPDAISKIWRDTLAGPIADSFRKWRKTRVIFSRFVSFLLPAVLCKTVRRASNASTIGRMGIGRYPARQRDDFGRKGRPRTVQFQLSFRYNLSRESAPTYDHLCQRLGFAVPRSYARFVELTIPNTESADWQPFPFLPFMQLDNAGPEAISISKPGDSVIFGWTGGDSEHFVFVIDDNGADSRERPVAFWPVDGQEQSGLVANSFPEFLEWLVAEFADEIPASEEKQRFLDLLKSEFGILRIRNGKAISDAARNVRWKQKGIYPTQDNIGVALPDGLVDRTYLTQIPWPKYETWRARPIPELLDEAERRLKAGELGTALILARNYRFLWWYDDWETEAQIIRRTAEVLSAAYLDLDRPAAASEIQRQTEWNLFNVT